VSVSEAASAALGEAALQWDHPPRETAPDTVMPAVASPRQHFLVHACPAGRKRWLDAMDDTPWVEDVEVLGDCSDAQIARELLSIAPDAAEVDAASPDVAAQQYTVVKVVAPGVPFLQFGRLGAARRSLAAHGLQPREDVHPFA
jgi:hypothetical protein